MPYEQLHVVQSPSLNRASGSGATRLQEDSQATEGQSFSSSQSDDLADTSPSMSTREKLEDDLAIAANLWQSYESMPNLIERKERDVDEYAGDAASDMHDDDVNSLNMIIIECEHGKAVVARLGVYRLFLLSRPTAPLGLLKVKSDNLRHFLASNLVCHSS
ncbi:hypothetical protein GGI04_003231 [Coemansia thaxteri]|uniref:Uncharacterized protein n=1 Tax=Coemansia thaxteri TaxID=2663907 RepID=A0A9W8BBJ2_9FUNG|nr:hypothetical protein H4R26_004109 [Coemansia thaxteri]KAJ2002697.1 hypothetical protein GGI04_003231 [Coemansia thaxteri]KAJ2471219.1 hypothetical protein GGI02_002414 [Coemansia sp. RSA 2322]KAJ2480386.1 hypothetical protein EV174_003747 [Coemansia sp. RSA 2320]